METTPKEHLRHYATFTTSNTRNYYEIREEGEGWFQYDDLVDLLKNDQANGTCHYSSRERELPYWDPRAGTLRTTKRSSWWHEFDDFTMIDRQEIKGVILTPKVVGVTAGIAQAEFTFTPAITTTWTDPNHVLPDRTTVNWDFLNSNDGLFIQMVQKHGMETLYDSDVRDLQAAVKRATKALDTAAARDPNSVDYWSKINEKSEALTTAKDALNAQYATLATEYADLVESRIDWDPPGHLCPNLFFAFGFRRAALDDDSMQAVEYLAGIAYMSGQKGFGTTCFFGGSARKVDEFGYYSAGFRWRLVCPLGKAPYLEQSTYSGHLDGVGTWTLCKWTSGSLSEVSSEGLATIGKTYHVGVMGNCICISEDYFKDNFAIYQVKDLPQPIIPYGGITLTNWPGQCAFWLAPLGFATSAPGINSFIQRRAVNVGNFRGDLIGTGRCYIYGFSPKGYYDPTAQAWPAAAPAWWPTEGYWWDGSDYVQAPFAPIWPPYGPPGQWPALPPPGWNFNDVWPPDPDTNPCPDPVNPTVLRMTGGGVDVQYWPVDSPPTGNPEWLAWRVSVEPTMWNADTTPGTPITHLPTFSTPFVEAVEIWQASAVQTPVNAQSYASPSAVHAATTAEAELGNDTAANVEVTLMNTPNVFGTGYPSMNLREGALCKVVVGTEFIDSSFEQISYNSMILTDIQATPTHTTLKFTDPFGAMNLAKWDFGDMNFRCWNVRTAMLCALNLSGIPASTSDFEDTGAILNGDWVCNLGKDPRTNADWTWKFGTSISQIVKDLAAFTGASVYFDPISETMKSGCPYCRTQRTSATYASHQDNGWASTGCIAADVIRAGNEEGVDWTLYADTLGHEASMIFAENFPGHGSRLTGPYVNRIIAQGKTAEGVTIRLRLQDNKAFGTDGTYDATHYVGWRKTEVIDVDGDATWSSLQQALLQKGKAFGERGIEVPDVPIPMNINVRVGQVMKVVGGEWCGADGIKFRVTKCVHDPTSGRTRVSLKQMIGLGGLTP